MLSVAVRAPLAEGLKVTAMVQMASAATELPQLLVWVKLPALAPETEMLVILKVALPVLVRVTVCAALVVWQVGCRRPGWWGRE